MKVLDPRVGMLSNREVLDHLLTAKARYTAEHERNGSASAMKAENLETVMKEVKDYLETTAAKTQSLEDIDNLMASLAPYSLEKAELLQIINERPDSIAELDCIVEEMDNRFDEDTQAVILEKIKEVLPKKPKASDIN